MPDPATPATPIHPDTLAFLIEMIRKHPAQASPLMNPTPELFGAISKLQGMLPKIERDRTVEVETKGDKANYGYSYATLAHLTERIMPKLSECGLGYSAFPGLSLDGKGMSVRYFLTHESGGYLGGEFPVPGEGGIQGLGGRITYVKRYALMAVTGLAAEEDDDAAAAQAEDEANGGARTAQRRTRATASKTEKAAANTERVNQRRAAVTGSPETPVSPAGPSAPQEAYNPPANPQAPLSDGAMKALGIQFTRLGVRDREGRLGRLTRLLGRPIGSSKEMTAGEGHEMIDLIKSAADVYESDGEEAANTMLVAYAEDIAARQAATDEAEIQASFDQARDDA